MGFAAGFGEGFSQAFGQARERAAKKQDDLFKMTYADYINRRDKYDEYKREDAKTAKKAESYMEAFGAPKEAYPLIYKWTASGMSADDIEQSIKTGSFKSEDPEKPQSPQTPTDDLEATDSSQQPQTAFSPNAPQRPAGSVGAQSEQDEPLGGIHKGTGLFSNLKNAFRRKSPEEQVAQVTGTTPENVRQTMTQNYTPSFPDASRVKFTPGNSTGKFEENLPAAIFKRDTALAAGNMAQAKVFDDMVKSHILANQIKSGIEKPGDQTGIYIIKGPDGQPTHIQGQYTQDGLIDVMTKQRIPEENILRPVSKMELQDWGTDLGDTKVVDEIKKEQTNLAMAYSTVNEIGQILQANKDILTARGTISKYVSDINRDVIGILNGIKASGANPDLMKQAQEYEKKINSDLLSNAITLGDKRALLDSKIALAAYKLANLEGQNGRDQSNKDVERFLNVVKSSSDPKILMNNLATYLKSSRENLNQKATAANQYNSNVEKIFSKYQYSPRQVVIPDFDQFMKATSGTDSYEKVKSYEQMQMDAGLGSPQGRVVQTPDDQIPTITTPQERDKLPPGTRYIIRTPDGQLIRKRKQ